MTIFSRSAEYALRALAHLATLPRDQFAMARTIAADADIPAHFLAKILQDLARDGFLQSVKGPGGGFKLARPANQISLQSVAAAVDGAARMKRCPLGLGECSHHLACGMHETWEPVQSRIIEYMGATSVADVAMSDSAVTFGAIGIKRPGEKAGVGKDEKPGQKVVPKLHARKTRRSAETRVSNR